MRVTALLALILVCPPIVHALAPVADAPGGAEGPVYPYHTWETLTLRLQELVAAHPDIARLHSAGESVLGLDLWVVEIADFENPDRVPLEEREVVWLDGGTHAREQLGMMLAYLWVEYLLEEYGQNETATRIVESRHTWIMPMVNPDGNHLDSRTNARGVNINRNYPVGWGAVDERIVGNYPGPYAASEPETRAVIEWVKRVQPDYFNSFHTGVDMMLYPYGYREDLPADNGVFARICEELGETDPEFCGPIYHTIYPASGNAVDFAYHETGAVAWTYEVSEEAGLYWSLEDPRVRMSRYWRGVEHAFLNVEKYGAHLRLAEVQVVDPDVKAPQLRLVLENDGYGPLEAAQATVRLGDSAPQALRLGSLGPGDRVSLPVSFGDVALGPEAGLQVRVEYPKRLEASRTASLDVDVPVEASGGRLVLLAEEETAVIDLSSERLSVPGVAPGLALALLGLAALAVRRWGVA